MNLVDLCKSQLGGAALSQLAGTLGLDHSEAKKATEAAAPSLLAALAGVASTPEGARRLDAAVDAADSPADALAAASSGGENYIEHGTSLLSSLLGGNNAISSLGGALSKFTGVGSRSIMSLLGAIFPMLLGCLKGQKQAQGLSSISDLLASQKGNIAAAMPSGLGGMLGGLGIPGLTGIGDWASRASGAASRTAGAAYDAGRGAYDSGREALAGAGYAAKSGASSGARWAIPIVAILVLAGLIWWIAAANHRSNEARLPQPQTPPAVANAAQGVKDSAKDAANKTADAANKAVDTGEATLAAAKTSASDMIAKLNTDATDTFSGVTNSLTSITDPASADAAIPKLKELPDKLDALKASMNSLSDENRAKVVDTLRPMAQKLNAALDKAMAVPGVSDKLQPYVQPVRDKLNALVPPAS